MAGIATAFVIAGGVELRLAAAAFAVCVIPAVLTVWVARAGPDWPRGRRAALVGLPWILMSSILVTLTGGMSSPALVFVVFPPLIALAFGWRKLAVETAVFSLVATLFAIFLSVAPLGLEGSAGLARASQMYALAGLCMLPFLVAGFVRQNSRDAPAGDDRLAPEPERTRPYPPYPLTSGSPAAGLDPVEEASADEETPGAIIDVTREGRVRSISGQLPGGLRLKPGGVFLEAFPESARQAVATRMTSGGTFRQALEDGRAFELTVDRHDLGVRVFLSEAGKEEVSPGPGGDDISARAAEAETALAERTAFFASLGHELKTPLNAILGFADIMRMELRGPMPEAYLDYSALIHESGQDLLLLVEDILDYARTEAGQVSLDNEPVDLAASAESVMAQLSGQAERAGVKLDLRAAGEVWAQADPRAVRQIWQNLLSNAIKYSDIGGTVTLDARKGRGAVALSVRDQGAGMDEEDLERIARPFQQGRNARGRAGTGLGLAVVKSFADAMKGKVIIDTAPGQGTRVRVILPEADAADLTGLGDAAE